MKPDDELPRTRAEAKAAGSKTYFTGKPCKRGHVAPRRVSVKVCVECERATTRAYYEENRERVAEHHRAYRTANQERIAEKKRDYREVNRGRTAEKDRNYRAANRDRIAEQHRAYREANQERIAEYHKANRERIAERESAYRKANPGKVRALHAQRRAAKLAATPPDADLAAIETYYAAAKHAERVTGEKYHVDHIVRLAKGGTHEAANLRITHAVENLKKSARLDRDLMARLAAAADYLREELGAELIGTTTTARGPDEGVDAIVGDWPT
jgi:hypothetical protein